MNLAIVCNLNPQRITWAKTFISCAVKNNLPVCFDKIPTGINRLFIGDYIPKEEINDNCLNLYFLAASSIPPSDSGKDTDIENEFRNINWADAVLLIGNSEKAKILTEGNKAKLFVVGFPIDIKLLSDIRASEKKNPKHVCFLGEIRPIKNFEFQKELLYSLKEAGYTCVHLSPKANNYKDDLLKADCQVIENISGYEYWKKVAECEYFISTSYYESLCISGIEASALGCKPVTPNHSGFQDWCPDGNRYSEYSVSNVMETISKAKQTNDRSNLIWKYDSLFYFRSLGKILKKLS